MRGTGLFIDRKPEQEQPKDAIFSGEFNHSKETVAAIVARAAHALLQSELEWSITDVLTAHPSLVGLTREQIAAAIAEALA